MSFCYAASVSLLPALFIYIILPSGGKYYPIQTSGVAWTSFTHGSSRDPATSSPVGTRGFQEEARSTARELGVVQRDLRRMGISWVEVEEAAEDRKSWRNRVAQSVFDAG